MHKTAKDDKISTLYTYAPVNVIPQPSLRQTQGILTGNFVKIPTVLNNLIIIPIPQIYFYHS